MANKIGKFELDEKWYKVAKNRLNKIEANRQTSLF